MEFLRELWFVLENVPSLAARYQKLSLWATVFLLLSVASVIVKNRFFASKRTEQTVLTFLSRTTTALTALVFVLAFVDLAKNRLPFDDLVCTDIGVDAYYHVPGDNQYELVQRQKCSNRTDHSIRNFVSLRDGYYERVPNWMAQSRLVSSSARIKFALLTRSEEERKNDIGGSKTLYLYRQTAEFDPPLPSGGSIDLVYHLSASGAPIELSAFSDDGTVFYRGVDYDTLIYDLTIHAPVGYEVFLLDWGVMDSSGTRATDEIGRQTAPHVAASGGLLQWRVLLARKHLRYMLRYRFEPYGW